MNNWKNRWMPATRTGRDITLTHSFPSHSLAEKWARMAMSDGLAVRVALWDADQGDRTGTNPTYAVIEKWTSGSSAI